MVPDRGCPDLQNYFFQIETHLFFMKMFISWHFIGVNRVFQDVFLEILFTNLQIYLFLEFLRFFTYFHGFKGTDISKIMFGGDFVV